MKALLALMMAGKLGKVLFSAGSMLLSVAIYAQLFGWKYAVGFVLLLLVHEMGHYIAARQRGLDVGLPTFIPFVGAWINLKNSKLDAETAAFVGMAGPLLGTTGAFVVYLAALHYQLNWLLAIAYAGFVLNLFNLIPVVPLDGGHVGCCDLAEDLDRRHSAAGGAFSLAPKSALDHRGDSSGPASVGRHSRHTAGGAGFTARNPDPQISLRGGVFGPDLLLDAGGFEVHSQLPR